MEDLDLDINNYELEDILSLFKLPTNYNEQHLKQAKQVVLKIHPDKSGLSADYFVFYSKAYKMLYSIWEFRKNSYNDKPKNTEYNKDTEFDQGKAKILDKFLEKGEMKDVKNAKKFNNWFNEQFEKQHLKTESDSKGYGDWLKSEDEDNSSLSSEAFAKKKRELREKTGTMVEYQDIHELNSSANAGLCELDMTAPSNFTSSMFSNLQYEDLHRAHTETIIPVTEEQDFDNRHQFRSLDEIKQHRNSQNIVPLSEIQAQKYLQSKTNLSDEKSVRVAYDLQKQLDKTKERNQDFWKSLQLLNN